MDMRRAGLVAIAACGVPDAFDLLCDAATSDTYDEVRSAAVTSLPQLDDPRASDVLKRVEATDLIEKVRDRAREMLEDQ
jgi:HEAT repeat protein